MAGGQLPIFFRKSSEAAIASYDWTDIAEGTGLITFFLCASEDSSSTSYNLITKEVYSEVIELSTSTSQSEDFDSPEFNLPMTVKGTAYLSCAARQEGGGDISITARLKKWDGTSETNISASITSSTKSGTDVKEMYFIKIPCTRTLIKKGEQLRLTLTITRTSSGVAATGIDPKNRDGTYVRPSTQTNLTTISKLYVPFKIDL